MLPKPPSSSRASRPDGARLAAFARLVELEKECAELRVELGTGPGPSLREELLDLNAYALIAKYATDMLSVHAGDGSYVFVSPACETLFGWKAEELIGHSAYDFIHPADFDRVGASHVTLPATEIERSSIEYRLRRPDGTYVWVETRSEPRLLDGELREIVCITRDVTERHEAAEAQARLIAELEAKIAEVQELKRLLPICAWCKSIRDDAGYWHEVDAYFASHGSVEFTHGVCPTCAANIRSHSERPANPAPQPSAAAGGRRASSRPPPKAE
ncbi:MAG: PAS domain S-box protein [Polyangiales bacterium]